MRGAMLGFAVLLGVWSLALWFALRQTARAEQSITTLAYSADRATYLAGDIGRQVNQLTVLIARQTSGTAPIRSPHELSLALLQLDRSMRELPGLLDDEHLRAFQQIEPVLLEFRETIARLANMPEDDPLAVRRAFEAEVMPAMREISMKLERLIQLTDENSRNTLVALQEELAFARWLFWAVGVSCIAILVVVAAVVLLANRRQERLIARQFLDLENANRDLDEFAARVAHDLRAPLAPMKLLATQLTRAENPNKVQEAGHRLNRQVDRADSLIRGLLAFSRGGDGARTGGRTSTTAAVLRVIEHTAGLASEAGVTIEQQTVEAQVGISDSLLLQVLDNLVVNAIKHMGNEPVRRVRIEVTQRAREVLFSVSDTGPGIPPERRETIFDPFTRLAPQMPGGVGLGLAIVKRIVEGHHGRVWVADNPKGGATFWFVLPIAEPSVTTRGRIEGLRERVLGPS